MTTTIDHTEHIVRLQRILHIIETEPERWNQRVWIMLRSQAKVHEEGIGEVLDENACGTAFCMAGWAAHLDPNVRWKDNDTIIAVPGSGSEFEGEGDVDIVEYAKRRLGMKQEECGLFGASTTLESARSQIHAIIGRQLAEMYPPTPTPKQWDVVIVTKGQTTITVEGVDEQEAGDRALSMYGLSRDEETVIDVVVTEHEEGQPF